MDNIIGLKDLRENLPAYTEKINQGATFLVVKKSKPIFRISPIEECGCVWEDVVDFTKIKKDGVGVKELLNRL